MNLADYKLAFASKISGSSDWKSAGTIAGMLLDYMMDDLTAGTNFFVGHLPDSPRNVVCVLDTSAAGQYPHLAISNDNFQVLVRHEEYQPAQVWVKKIRMILESAPTLTVEGVDIVGIWMESSFSFIGRDENDDYVFSGNFRIITKDDQSLNKLGSFESPIDPVPVGYASMLQSNGTTMLANSTPLYYALP